MAILVPSSPFHEHFLPEIWLLIRDWVAGGTERSHHRYSVCRAMLALTCRAEYATMCHDDDDDAEEICIVARKGRIWFNPRSWWQDATACGYLAICTWIWTECDARWHRYLHLDNLLFRGYFEEATELERMFRVGCSSICQADLARADKLEGLKWIVEQEEYLLERKLLQYASLAGDFAVLRWLVEEQKQDVREIPGLLSECVARNHLVTARYVIDRGACIESHSSYYNLATSGRWTGLDFLREHFPGQYAEACALRPVLAVRHAARAVTRWGFSCNWNDTGPNVVKWSPAYDDDDEEEDD